MKDRRICSRTFLGIFFSYVVWLFVIVVAGSSLSHSHTTAPTHTSFTSFPLSH